MFEVQQWERVERSRTILGVAKWQCLSKLPNLRIIESIEVYITLPKRGNVQ